MQRTFYDTASKIMHVLVREYECSRDKYEEKAR